MSKINSIEDHMAVICEECGSVNFVLLKSGKIECSSCRSFYDNVKWVCFDDEKYEHDTIPIDANHKEITDDILGREECKQKKTVVGIEVIDDSLDSPLVEFLVDCKKIQEVFLKNGLDPTLRQCEEMWCIFSLSMDAGWLVLPDNDEEIMSILSPYFREKHMAHRNIYTNKGEK